MQKVIYLFIVLHFAAVGFAQSDTQIIGKWQSSDDKTRVIEIYQAKNKLYYGKNADGKLIFQELKYDAANKSFSGIMAPLDSGITLNISITYESD